LDGDGSADASSVQALWTMGYSMGNDSFKHGPFAGLEYQNVDVDSFEESGPLPLSVDSYDVDSLRALIGYRLDATYDKVRPYASIAYAHEFEDDEIDAEADFAGNSFSVNGPAQGSAILLTAGVGFSLSERLSMDVGYRGEISVEDEGLDSHGGSIGLNYSF
jgi:outer membrane autotransporter protein